MAQRPEDDKLLSLIAQIDKLEGKLAIPFAVEVREYLFKEMEYRMSRSSFALFKEKLLKEEEGNVMQTLEEMFHTYSRKEGKREGEDLAMNRVVSNMLDLGLSLDIIAQSTCLKAKDIRQISEARRVPVS